MTLYQKTYVTATERATRKCGHGWQNCSQLPPETGVGVRIPGTSVPQQPVLHGRQGDSVFCGRCGSCVQHQGAQAEILSRAQRWHNQVVFCLFQYLGQLRHPHRARIDPVVSSCRRWCHLVYCNMIFHSSIGRHTSTQQHPPSLCVTPAVWMIQTSPPTPLWRALPLFLSLLKITLLSLHMSPLVPAGLQYQCIHVYPSKIFESEKSSHPSENVPIESVCYFYLFSWLQKRMLLIFLCTALTSPHLIFQCCTVMWYNNVRLWKMRLNAVLEGSIGSGSFLWVVVTSAAKPKTPLFIKGGG